jgi:murein DD-endopeptidase MepM/ murein hydrolase activator NlpD
VIRHFNGLETVYAHLSMSRVRQNDLVKAGELIGYGGSTGRSTGPHLHFEVRYLGTPMNPRKVINFENYCLHSDTLLITRYTFEKKSMKSGVNPNLTAAKTGGQNYQSSGTTTYSGNKTYHYVRKGETLSHIAVKYNTSVTSLCKLNGLTSKSVLQIGQKIRVR